MIKAPVRVKGTKYPVAELGFCKKRLPYFAFQGSFEILLKTFICMKYFRP